MEVLVNFPNTSGYNLSILSKMGLGIYEVFFLQLIIYALIYIVDAYLGFLICLVTGSIAVAIFFLGFVFEWIEKSKIPKSYYYYMLTAVIAPWAVLAIFSIFMEGSFDWMQE